jgi:hypothetical protein
MLIAESSYGDTYNNGYIGFTYRDNNIFSKGIMLFTKEEADKICVSHSFIVRDDKLLIEASIHGVQYRLLTDYFDNPHIHVFFKKPINLDKDRANRIIAHAESHLGCRYDYGLIAYFFKKYLLNKLGYKSSLLGRYSMFDNPNKFLCSEFVADSISSVSEYMSLFPLNSMNPAEIDPMMLFRSPLFKEWKYDR